MSRLSLLAAALVAVVASGAPPARAREPVPARPIGNPGDWVTSSDYPSSELNRGATGTTEFGLTIGMDGVPSDCTIIASSGSTTLDATTCALIKARARFEPARDDRGKKIVGVYSNRVRWVLPGNVAIPLPEKSEVTTLVALDEKGVIRDCAFSGLRDVPTGAGAVTPCTRFPVGSKMRPFEDAHGFPIAVRMIIRHSTEVVPDPAGRGVH